MARFTLLLVVLQGTLTITAQQTSLKSVQIVFRHGKKANDNGYGVRTGLLNDIGKQEMYELGKVVRRRYGNFIKTDYDPGEIEILSSAANRCVQSGTLFAYGFYEEHNQKANWSGNAKINYDPIPVQTIPPQIDKYLQMTMDCPRKEALKMEVNDKILVKFVKDNPEYIRAYIENTGDLSIFNKSISSVDRLFKLVTILDPSVTESKPDWVQPFLGLHLFEGFKYDYNEGLYSSDTELLALETGPFVEMLYNRMNVSGEYKKLFVYSSHDFSISALTAIFGLDFRTFPPDPPTGSTYFLEVHQDEDRQSPFIKVHFKNGTSMLVLEIENIPGCSPKCHVTDFYDLIKNIIPENYEDSCKLETEEKDGLQLLGS